MRNNSGERKPPVAAVLNIVIAILGVLIVVTGFRTASEFVEISRNEVEESAYVRYLEDENFNAIWNAYYNDTARTKDKQEYYALAQYYEAHIFYTAFTRVGDMERAERYAERMAEAAEEMGDFIEVKKKIDVRVE